MSAFLLVVTRWAWLKRSVVAGVDAVAGGVAVAVSVSVSVFVSVTVNGGDESDGGARGVGSSLETVDGDDVEVANSSDTEVVIAMLREPK